MLLGKRPRPPMRRTTSMRALPAEELVTMQESPAAALGSAAPGGNFKVEQPKQRSITTVNNKSGTAATALANSDGGNSKGNGREFALSPRGGSSSSSRPRRNSADLLLMDATHFLRSCTLCKRPIGPGRDIYMYRGDTAYCSVECRQQQVNLDEKKAKCSVRSLKKEAPPAASETSAKGETAAAA